MSKISHLRAGHWRQTPNGPVFVGPAYIKEPDKKTPEQREKRLEEIRERAKKKKRSLAAKKAWKTRREKAAKLKAKKKFRSIDDESKYG